LQQIAIATGIPISNNVLTALDEHPCTYTILPVEQIPQSRFQAAIVISPDDCQYLHQSSPYIAILGVCDPTSTARKAMLSAGASHLLSAPLEPVELIHTLQYLEPPFDVDIIGHDLKSPSGIIVSGLSVMQELVASDPILKQLTDDALTAAHRQSDLLDAMLDYYRLYNGNYNFLPVAFSPAEFFETLNTIHTPIMERKGCAFNIIETPVPETILSDQRLLMRIVSALLDNSLKFCTSEDTITLAYQVTDNHFQVTISDTGRQLSIDPSTQQNLFSLRHQFELRMQGERTSVAFNLPFAAIAIQYLGGRLTLQARHDNSSVMIDLPLKIVI